MKGASWGSPIIHTLEHKGTTKTTKVTYTARRTALEHSL